MPSDVPRLLRRRRRRDKEENGQESEDTTKPIPVDWTIEDRCCSRIFAAKEKLVLPPEKS